MRLKNRLYGENVPKYFKGLEKIIHYTLLLANNYLMFLCPVVGGVVGGVAGVLIAVLVAVILVLALHIITLRRHLQERRDFPGLI